MAETKIVSGIYKINSAIDSVYSLLSDFNRIGTLVNLAKQMGASTEALSQVSDKIEDIRFSEDTCSFTVKGMGDVAVKIVEKEAPKMIKLGGDGSLPFEFNLWIQLLDKGPYDTRLRLTFIGELNFMLKMMLKGKLEKGINQLAEGLTKIPYSMLG
ncbi:hypothetical protein [Odoribacter lunatus]|uniref:hypothetical protein n=1 Tax=Odoribacter lunatus TaxID=2941335 RepID=UPI00203BBB64|nr:hypothetical protein [Odoribacter lunatus]